MNTEKKTNLELARETIAELREEYASNPETRYSMALCMADAVLKEKQEKENPTTIYEKMCVDKVYAAWAISVLLHNADYEEDDYDPAVMDALNQPLPERKEEKK
jgi:hypothetical protein